MPAAMPANSVVEITFKTTSEFRPNDVFVNRLRYRAVASVDSTTLENWTAALTTADFDGRWWAFASITNNTTQLITTVTP